MIELNPIQRQILRSLTFPEPFDTLVEEVKGTQPVIGAELKYLIAKGLVTVIDRDDRGRDKPSIFYDSDNMRAFRYQISAKGLRQMED
jgi:hypothetical protein